MKLSRLFSWLSWFSDNRKPPQYAENTAKWNSCFASSFADPQDVEAFWRAKRKGMSDKQAFAYGDNGIGCWGDDTTKNVPMCALPPEDWRHLGSKARGKIVLVRIGNKTIQCELRDTMPKKANIKNGCGIDLNPAAVAAFGMKPPIKVSAMWRYL